LHGFPEGLEGQFPDRPLVTSDEATLAHTNDRYLFHEKPPFTPHPTLSPRGEGKGEGLISF